MCCIIEKLYRIFKLFDDRGSICDKHVTGPKRRACVCKAEVVGVAREALAHTLWSIQ
jgi:hypothetical protein